MNYKSNGWGLREMMFFVSILMFFLLIAVILIMRLYNNLEETMGSMNQSNNKEQINTKYYQQKETELFNAAADYADDIAVDTSNGSVNVYLKDLIDYGYAQSIVDEITKNNCDGYARFYDTQGILDIDVYLKCDNYVTEGYIG